jgi:hypothetical protein
MGLSESSTSQLGSCFSQVRVRKGKVEPVLLRFRHLLLGDSKGLFVTGTQDETTGADV